MRTPLSASSYAILGCGSVGHAVAEELTEAGEDVKVYDADPARVEALRDQDLDAHEQDITEPAVAEAVADRDVVVILTSEMATNRAAVEAIRAAGGEQFVVVRASDPVSADELVEAGADVVITPSEVIAESALRALEAGELAHKARRLVEVLEATDGTLAIVAHDTPDPDSIAAAVALRAIAAAHGVDAEIVYDGEIGHQESSAFVNTLGIELTARDEAGPLAAYGGLAVIHYADSGGIALDADVDIYLDHEDPSEPVDATFTDVRRSVSATSTILTKHLQELDMAPDETVVTALLYGIRAETVDFKRDTTPEDLTAAAFLHPFADHDTLEEVESPSMSPETLDVLAQAIQNREVRGSHLISNAGFVTDREALAQAAGQLLDLEGVTTTAVFGVAEDRILLSARSTDIRLNIGDVLRDAFGEVGEAAGHAKQGSAEIPLGLFTGIEISDENRETLLSLSEEAVRRKLFDALGVDGDSTNGS